MTALDNLRSDLASVVDGNATVTLPTGAPLTVTVADLATALGVTRVKPVTVLYTGYISDTLVHGRAAPGLTGAIIVQAFGKGDAVSVYSDPPVTANGMKWLHVLYNNIQCWVAAIYVSSTPIIIVSPPVTPKHRLGFHFLQDASGPVAWVGSHRIASATVVDNNGLANQLIAEGVPYVLARSCGVANGDAFTVPNDPATATAYGTALFNNRLQNFSDLNPLVYIQLLNEGPFTPGHNAFWLAVMADAEARGRKIALGGFAVGGPEPADWATMTPALQHAASHGHIVCLHEYTAQNTPAGQLSATNLQQYYELRFLRFYNAVPANARPPLVIGEFGNWDATNNGATNEINLCKSFEAAIGSSAPYLVGYNYWTFGGAGGWAQSDITANEADFAAWLSA